LPGVWRARNLPSSLLALAKPSILQVQFRENMRVRHRLTPKSHNTQESSNTQDTIYNVPSSYTPCLRANVCLFSISIGQCSNDRQASRNVLAMSTIRLKHLHLHYAAGLWNSPSPLKRAKPGWWLLNLSRATESRVRAWLYAEVCMTISCNQTHLLFFVALGMAF